MRALSLPFGAEPATQQLSEDVFHARFHCSYVQPQVATFADFFNFPSTTIQVVASPMSSYCGLRQPVHVVLNCRAQSLVYRNVILLPTGDYLRFLGVLIRALHSNGNLAPSQQQYADGEFERLLCFSHKCRQGSRLLEDAVMHKRNKNHQ